MLVFQSTASELPITAGAKTATLKTGQSLWLFNVPTTDPPVDETPQIVEHAHDYFEILSPPLDHPENALIQTWTRYDRIPPKRNVGRFVHPCAIAPLRADSQAHPLATPAIVYFPPDTDPCFLVQA